MADEVRPDSAYGFLISIADRFGVPVLLLAAVLWMIRDAGLAIHQTVLVPIVESHTKFLETTQETLTEIGKTQDTQARTMQELAVGQREIQAAIQRQGDSKQN
jgi:hypothetical protein